jgi:hypothetical protein
MSEDRAVSEVLSYAFIFALIVISIGIVSIAGMGTLQDAQTIEQIRNAEQAYDILQNNMADIYRGGAPSRATEISLGDSEIYFGDNVTVNVTVEETDGDETVVEYDLRPVVQRLGDERFLIYEAGAVFRTNRDSGIVVREPPQIYRSGNVHVTVPAFQAQSVQAVGSSNVLVRAKATDRSVPVRDTSDSIEQLNVTITSPRYAQWEAFLSDQPLFESADCAVNENREMVWCEESPESEIPGTVYVVVHEADISLIK